MSLTSIDIRHLKRTGALNSEMFVLFGKALTITWVDWFFEGRRAFFLCPGCERRAAILYIDCEGQILCRQCHGLTYQSQNENRFDRLLRKARKIRERLGASHDLFRPILSKPKGMHWKTFETLRLEAEEASTRATAFCALDLAAIEKRWQRREEGC